MQITEVNGRACLAGVPLACPNDRKPLTLTAGVLRCPDRHEYPLVGDVAVMFNGEIPDSHPYFEESRQASRTTPADQTTNPGADEVDPFVQQEIVKTNGLLYQGVLGGLRRYPIPDIPLPETAGGLRLLDIGCNWGRWSIAASRRGYQAIGIDPGLAAIQAAYRAVPSPRPVARLRRRRRSQSAVPRSRRSTSSSRTPCCSTSRRTMPRPASGRRRA